MLRVPTECLNRLAEFDAWIAPRSSSFSSPSTGQPLRIYAACSGTPGSGRAAPSVRCQSDRSEGCTGLLHRLDGRGFDVVEAESPPADPPSPRRAEEGSTRLRAPGPRGIILPVFTPSAGRRTALRERRRLSALGARLRTPLSSVSKTISALRSQIYGRGPRSPPRAAGYRYRTNR
jgi:hypothetical protein